MPPFPFVPGYSALGRVEAVGEGVNVPLGTRVLTNGTARLEGAHKCWGGHCAHHVVAANSLVSVPDNVDDKNALMVRLASIAFRGVRLARPLPDESVVVVGLGPVGQCSARLFAAAGANVLALDRVAERVELLQKQGIDARVTDDVVQTAREKFPTGAAIVVDASGAAPLAALVPQLLQEMPWDALERQSPRLVVQGSYVENVLFNPAELFSHEATVLFPRDAKIGDQHAVLSLLERQKLELGDILTQIAAPTQCAEIYGKLRERGDFLCAGFDWRR